MESPKEFPLEELFQLYAKFGDTSKSGDSITLQCIDKWMKQALAFNKHFTSTDTAIEFSQIAKTRKNLNFTEFLRFLTNLSTKCHLDENLLKRKLLDSGPPLANKSMVVNRTRNRLSDPSRTNAKVQKRPIETLSLSMAASGEPQSIEELFRTFAKFGDAKSTGEAITLSNIDKWFKQAKVIDGKKITTTDTGIYFKQTAKTKKSISYKEFQDFIEALAKSKKIESSSIHKKLEASGPPGTTGTTTIVKTAAVNRLTDTSKYTGSHKQRFDETGKGRGKEGREEAVDTSGYVSGYKEAGSYEEKH